MPTDKTPIAFDFCSSPLPNGASFSRESFGLPPEMIDWLKTRRPTWRERVASWVADLLERIAAAIR